MNSPDRILRITKLVVVESLRQSDIEAGGHTGEALARDVASALDRAGVLIAVQVLRCAGAEGFREAIAFLTAEAERGEHLPVLHVECHGDEDGGLEFGDGSTLSWNELAEVIRPLNVATELGLIVAVAACFGGHAIAGIDPLKPAPCFAIIGATEGLWSNELYDGLRDFYVNVLARTTTDEATRTLLDKPLESGQFVVLTVRQWFKEVILGVLDRMASPKAREAQALRQYEQALAEGFDRDLDFWRRHYLETLPVLLANYHREFFMTDRFPTHAQHFQQSLTDILQGLQNRGMAA
ncbi:hypothetical protein ACSFBF_28745 [Variovorax sp. ZT5P49]|uniref:hypothetical protein n=1 Tax=Variovorax sp. ZT5P49 TaxID=3443733 RepID=UPI003F45BEEF